MNITFNFLMAMLLGGMAVLANAASVTELQPILQSIHSLQADFQQVITSETGRVLQRLNGKVWLKKPARFRWEVFGKEPRLVVSDGKQVWDYDEDLAQVTVQKLNAGQMRAPIFFLTGDAHSLDKEFKIMVLPIVKGQCLEHCNACFELYPKRQEGSFQWIRIGFKDKFLSRMELLDQLGQHSVFVFKQVELNIEISDTLFQFKPPANVDILRNESF